MDSRVFCGGAGLGDLAESCRPSSLAEASSSTCEVQPGHWSDTHGVILRRRQAPYCYPQNIGRSPCTDEFTDEQGRWNPGHGSSHGNDSHHAREHPFGFSESIVQLRVPRERSLLVLILCPPRGAGSLGIIIFGRWSCRGNMSVHLHSKDWSLPAHPGSRRQQR